MEIQLQTEVWVYLGDLLIKYSGFVSDYKYPNLDRSDNGFKTDSNFELLPGISPKDLFQTVGWS